MAGIVSVILTVLEFLLPGYAWLLIMGLSKRFGALESIVLSFILSSCILSLASAGISLLTRDYLFVSEVVMLVLSLGIAGLYALNRMRLGQSPALRRISVKVDRYDLPLLVALTTYAILLTLLFWSAPYYPTASANDPVVHIQLAQGVLNGEGKQMLLRSGYPIGMHFAIVIFSTLLQLDLMLSMRIYLALVTLCAIFLSYTAARTILSSRRMAGAAVLVAAFVMPVDGIHFVLFGTFANLIADTIILSMVCFFFYFVRKPSLPVGLTLALLGVAGVFMHSSVALFLGVLWVSIPMVFLLFKKKLHEYVQACFYSVAGIILLGLVLSSVLAHNGLRLLGTYTLFGGPGIVAAFRYPAIFYAVFVSLIINLGVIMGRINAVAVFASVVFVLARRRTSSGPIFAAGWFVILMAGVFLTSGNSDRFILFSMLPSAFVLGSVASSADQLTEKVSRLRFSWSKVARIIVPLVLIMMIGTGLFFPLVFKAYNPSDRAHEQAVFDSMEWLKGHNGTGSVASVGLGSDYRYLTGLTGVPYAGDFNKPAQSLLPSSKGNLSYVAVSINSPHIHSYDLNSTFHEEYHNDVVAIFQIKP
jgi:hypothetical protein